MEEAGCWSGGSKIRKCTAGQDRLINDVTLIYNHFLRRLERVFLVAIVFVKQWKVPKKDNS